MDLTTGLWSGGLNGLNILDVANVQCLVAHSIKKRGGRRVDGVVDTHHVATRNLVSGFETNIGPDENWFRLSSMFELRYNGAFQVRSEVL